jgi:formylglycine-generating enzyme required for sulfatase activity
VDDATDVGVADVPPSADIPVVDVGSVDVPAAPDASAVVDAAPTADAPPAVDVPDVPTGADVADVPTAVDGGTCPTGMVLIPAGTFTMGDTDTTSTGAQPPHSVTLSAYCMGLTEVTVAAYSTCTATGCTLPNNGGYCNWNVAGRGNHPINCVAWSQARAYCQSLGGDLPTEAQWEYAARGTDGRTYPWGNAAPLSQLCWGGTGSRTSTCPVQSFPSGVSPFGLFDMGGNVWEWSLDWYAAYSPSDPTDPTGPGSGTDRVDRGGDWSVINPLYLRAATRSHVLPTYRDAFLGFRCVHAPL